MTDLLTKNACDGAAPKEGVPREQSVSMGLAEGETLLLQPEARSSSETRGTSARTHSAAAKLPWTDGPAGLLFLVVVDLFALFDALALGYLCRFRWGFIMPPLEQTASPTAYLQAWGVAIYLGLLLFHAYGLYDRSRTRDPIDVLSPLFRAVGWALLLILSLSYFYRDFSYSRVSVIYTCGFGAVILGTWRACFEAYRNRLRARDGFQKPVLLVGSRTLPRFLEERMRSDRRYGYEVVAVADSVPITAEQFQSLPTGGLDRTGELIDLSGAREVLVGHPALGHHDLLRILEACENRSVPVRMVPATFDLLLDPEDLQEVGGIPLVTINERRHRPGYRAGKRALDLFLASTLLVMSAPVLGLLALWIRFDSRGPVLFRQRRVGVGGRVFEMLKFRTMVDNAESLLPDLVDFEQLSEPVFKLDSDPRVTRAGRFLRRLSLDEVPQLLNVLRGDMSLVGPRPEEEALVERYDIWQRRRLKLKPGITGLQQLHCRGSRSLEERVRWDIVYLRKESLLLDLWILFRTVGVVLRGQGAR